MFPIDPKKLTIVDYHGGSGGILPPSGIKGRSPLWGFRGQSPLPLIVLIIVLIIILIGVRGTTPSKKAVLINNEKRNFYGKYYRRKSCLGSRKS